MTLKTLRYAARLACSVMAQWRCVQAVFALANGILETFIFLFVFDSGILIGDRLEGLDTFRESLGAYGLRCYNCVDDRFYLLASFACGCCLTILYCGTLLYCSLPLLPFLPLLQLPVAATAVSGAVHPGLFPPCVIFVAMG